MNAQHTPGPWRVFDATDSNDHCAITFRVGDTTGFIGSVYTKMNFGRIDPDERDANARLISAAPDLLAACKELRDGLAAAFRVISEHGATVIALESELKAAGVANGFGVRANAAIAKAEGASAAMEVR